MDDNPRVEHGDERETVNDAGARAPDDPTTATNDSNVGTLAGRTGPTPLTGAQILSATTDDPDPVI